MYTQVHTQLISPVGPLRYNTFTHNHFNHNYLDTANYCILASDSGRRGSEHKNRNLSIREGLFLNSGPVFGNSGPIRTFPYQLWPKTNSRKLLNWSCLFCQLCSTSSYIFHHFSRHLTALPLTKMSLSI